MPVKEIDGQQYIPVDEARQLLGLGYKDMARLLEARALQFRRDFREQTIQWVLAADVQDAVGYRERCRHEEHQRMRKIIPQERDVDQTESEIEHEQMFTFSASDLGTFLLAVVCYFDAERDIYFGGFDERDDINKTVRVISRIYTWLERESDAGRSISEIVMEIYEQRPDERARDDIFSYLINKAQGGRKKPKIASSSNSPQEALRRNALTRRNGDDLKLV